MFDPLIHRIQDIENRLSSLLSYSIVTIGKVPGNAMGTWFFVPGGYAGSESSIWVPSSSGTIRATISGGNALGVNDACTLYLRRYTAGAWAALVSASVPIGSKTVTLSSSIIAGEPLSLSFFMDGTSFSDVFGWIER